MSGRARCILRNKEQAQFFQFLHPGAVHHDLVRTHLENFEGCVFDDSAYFVPCNGGKSLVLNGFVLLVEADKIQLIHQDLKFILTL